MLKREEISNPDSTLNKAFDDEPIFVLRAADPEAPETVEYWAMRRSQRDPHSPKPNDAIALATKMRSQHPQWAEARAEAKAVASEPVEPIKSVDPLAPTPDDKIKTFMEFLGANNKPLTFHAMVDAGFDLSIYGVYLPHENLLLRGFASQGKFLVANLTTAKLFFPTALNIASYNVFNSFATNLIGGKVVKLQSLAPITIREGAEVSRGSVILSFNCE